MEEFVNTFKALGDKTRLRIVWVLSQANSKLCVCEITDSIGESHYNASRHLKVLKNAGLVREEKEGRWVFYSLSSPTNSFQELVLRTISTLPEESLSLYTERLNKRLSLRKNGKCVIGLDSEEWRKMLREFSQRR